MNDDCNVMTCTPKGHKSNNQHTVEACRVVLQDLKKKEKFREKFSVEDDWVLPYEVVPIIDIPGFGDTAAVKACRSLHNVFCLYANFFSRYLLLQKYLLSLPALENDCK